MSADRTVHVGYYGHSLIRCDGFRNGRRCTDSVHGEFRGGIKSAREIAASRGWLVGVRVFGRHIRDYCRDHNWEAS